MLALELLGFMDGRLKLRGSCLLGQIQIPREPKLGIPISFNVHSSSGEDLAPWSETSFHVASAAPEGPLTPSVAAEGPQW